MKKNTYNESLCCRAEINTTLQINFNTSIHFLKIKKDLLWPQEPQFPSDQETSKYIRKHSSLVAQMVKNLPAIWETWAQSLGREDPPEKGMATHSSILAWRIPWTEEPGGLQSKGCEESDMTEWLITNYN